MEALTIDGEIASIEEVLPQEHNVYRINSIKKLYPAIRQKSKAPTFALTYRGTWHTLMQNCNMSEEKAKNVERAYHDLYKESDLYCQKRLEQAAKEGYTKVAFGLKVRCPTLQKALLDCKDTPVQAQKEARTVNNSFGQSYCALTMRAFIAFDKLVRKSQYKYDIVPCATIHDAVYYIIKDDADVLNFCKEGLEREFSWQEFPEIKHDVVKLNGVLDYFYPTWAEEHGIDE